MSKNPFAFRLLRTFCPDHLYEEIEGDLIQKFNRDKQKFSNRKATLKLYWHTLRFFRPGILFRRKLNTHSKPVFMLGNYFKTTYRHISRQKGNAAIKLAGLTMALICATIVEVYVSYQLSFDKAFNEFETIYRVNTARKEDNTQQLYAVVPPALGATIKTDFTDIKAFTRIGIPSHTLIRYKEQSLRPYGFAEADSSVFEVFSFNFIDGNKTALTKPNSVVLTKSLADQIFGNENPIGKPLTFAEYNNKIVYVTAVIEDLPPTTHFNFRALTSINDLNNDAEDVSSSWSLDDMTYLYVKLTETTNINSLEKQITAVAQQHIQSQEDDSEKNFAVAFQPLTDIYLDPALKMDFFKKGNAMYVYIFSLLGIFLLIIAGINYLNISVADFSGRIKELALRKVLGARKKQLIAQISVEAVFYCATALTLSFLGLYLLFPIVVQKLEPNLSFAHLTDSRMILLIGCSLVLLLMLSIVGPTLLLSMNTAAGFLKAWQWPGIDGETGC